jgi:hypothetical protein
MTDEHYDFKLAFDKVLDKGYTKANLSETEKQSIYEKFLEFKLVGRNGNLEHCNINFINIMIFKITGVFSEIYKLDNHWLKRFHPNQNGTIYSILNRNIPSKHSPGNVFSFPFILTCLFDGINHALAKLNDDVAHNTECINDICKDKTQRVIELESKVQHQTAQIQTLERRLQEMEKRLDTYIIRATIPPPPPPSVTPKSSRLTRPAFHFN